MPGITRGRLFVPGILGNRKQGYTHTTHTTRTKCQTITITWTIGCRTRHDVAISTKMTHRRRSAEPRITDDLPVLRTVSPFPDSSKGWRRPSTVRRRKVSTSPATPKRCCCRLPLVILLLWLVGVRAITKGIHFPRAHPSSSIVTRSEHIELHTLRGGM